MAILEIQQSNNNHPYYTCWLVYALDKYCLAYFNDEDKASQWGKLFFRKYQEKRNSVNDKKINIFSKEMEDILREMPPDDEDIE